MQVSGQSWSFEHIVLIGRADDCQVRLDVDEVAPHHAQISTEDGELWLKVMQTDARVYINGAPATSVVLASGDEIRIGPCRLILQAPGLRPERVLQPVSMPKRSQWPFWLTGAALLLASITAAAYFDLLPWKLT